MSLQSNPCVLSSPTHSVLTAQRQSLQSNPNPCVLTAQRQSLQSNPNPCVLMAQRQAQRQSLLKEQMELKLHHICLSNRPSLVFTDDLSIKFGSLIRKNNSNDNISAYVRTSESGKRCFVAKILNKCILVMNVEGLFKLCNNEKIIKNMLYDALSEVIKDRIMTVFVSSSKYETWQERDEIEKTISELLDYSCTSSLIRCWFIMNFANSLGICDSFKLSCSDISIKPTAELVKTRYNKIVMRIISNDRNGKLSSDRFGETKSHGVKTIKNSVLTNILTACKENTNIGHCDHYRLTTLTR